MTDPLRPLRRVRRAVTGAVTGMVIFCLLGSTLALLFGLFDEGDVDYEAADGCGNGQLVNPTGSMPTVNELEESQVRIAAIIVRVGQDRQVPPRGWIIAVATALQESRLRNLPFLGAANDHDSIGVFQQRPSQGWGTPEQLADPAYQANQFYARLVEVPDWQTLPLTEAAQAVQRSGFPDAYAQWEPLATFVVNALTGGAGLAAGYDITVRCADVGDITAAGWTLPAPGPIWSGFRTAARPNHQGVDIGAPRGHEIHAATAGTVIVSKCNAHIGNTPYSCDRDGGYIVLGCGWYVDILHAGGIVTRYCHMGRQPLVAVGDTVVAGQVIGYVGSSGNSSGPHLHFEVHVNGGRTAATAVDPVPFMLRQGIRLGATA